jgi:hypothetical protein
MPDRDVLKLAAVDGRVLVSRDVTTMPVHFEAFVASLRSAGVILIPGKVTVGEAVERLLILWLSWAAEDIQNQIWWLAT